MRIYMSVKECCVYVLCVSTCPSLPIQHVIHRYKNCYTQADLSLVGSVTVTGRDVMVA